MRVQNFSKKTSSRQVRLVEFYLRVTSFNNFIEQRNSMHPWNKFTGREGINDDSVYAMKAGMHAIQIYLFSMGLMQSWIELIRP